MRLYLAGALALLLALLTLSACPATQPAPTASPAARPVTTAAATPNPAPSVTAATSTASPAATAPRATAASGAAVTTLVVETASGRPVAVRAELVNNNQTRALGLMNRDSVPEGTGMLFLFPTDTTAGFWMESTRVALSIAFVDREGIIVSLDDMQPLSRDVHQPSRAYRYALEVPQGFYARNGVKAGDRVRYQRGAELLPLADLPEARQAK